MNSYQAAQFSKHGVRRRDPMSVTMIILLELERLVAGGTLQPGGKLRPGGGVPPGAGVGHGGDGGQQGRGVEPTVEELGP